MTQEMRDFVEVGIEVGIRLADERSNGGFRRPAPWLH